MTTTTILVSWPSAPLTERLVLDAVKALDNNFEVVGALGDKQYDRLIQWSSYDEIDHELTFLRRDSVVASSYTFRKALIRKHFLAHSIHSYLAKNPTSVLTFASPQTFDLDLAFADELDEKWVDDLYELSGCLEQSPEKWWILKPGMADRGMGIRLFNTKAALEQIFEEFDMADSESEGIENGDETPNTTVVTSQLRHFVIQEYILSPLLLDPREIPIGGGPRLSGTPFRGHKFHLRAYCVASGALQLYLYDRVLALFCSVPYSPPVANVSHGELYPKDLQAHLTNTSLRADQGEQGVRLFDELVGCHVGGKHAKFTDTFTEIGRQNIMEQMTQILAETFRAALQNPVHFQPFENGFELYGVDFLVAQMGSGKQPYQVKILEINAEPAIELTGPRLTWILEGLFDSIAKVCVGPFINQKAVSAVNEPWGVGQTKVHLIKCLDEAVRGRGAPTIANAIPT